VTEVFGQAITWAGGNGTSATARRTASIDVAHAVSAIAVTDITSSPNSTPNELSETALAVGENVITFRVTAQNGTTHRFYQITINRAESGIVLSNAAEVTSIRGESVTWAGGNGSSATTRRTAEIEVANNISTVTAASITRSAGSSVSELTPTALSVGENVVTFRVTAQDGVTVVYYQVTIIRAQGTTPPTPDCDCGKCECEECGPCGECEDCKTPPTDCDCGKCECEECGPCGECEDCKTTPTDCDCGKCDCEECGPCGECEDCKTPPTDCDCGKCECEECGPCGECEDCVSEVKAFHKGDVTNTGRIEIGDVLEVLKFLARIQNNVLERGITRGGHTEPGGPGSRPWVAAQILPASRATPTTRPGIGDVLEMLKVLARIPTDHLKQPNPAEPVPWA
jgi:hypothetical protein